jgi:hypothetical protein
MPLYDKLSVINSALTRTGENLVGAEGDGSPEWITASDAYETELPLLIEAHSWGFGKTTATLTRTGSSPIPGFSDRFAKPAGCLHVLQVWVNDLPVDYDIADNQIQCSAAGAAPVALYLQRPATPDQWPEGFVEVLRLRVMSWIYRGLKEDPATAERVYAQSTMMLNEARTRATQEVPAKALRVQRMRMVRNTRRGL